MTDCYTYSNIIIYLPLLLVLRCAQNSIRYVSDMDVKTHLFNVNAFKFKLKK